MAEADGDSSPEGTAVTLRDVARAANVHVSTVSRALDPTKASLVSASTRAKVTAAAQELGYRPHLVASGLRRGRTMTVGVVVPDLANPIYAPVVRGIAHALDRENYVPLVADTEDDTERFSQVINHLLGRRVDALITTAARRSDQDRLLACYRSGTPIVVAVRTLPESGLPAVQHDDAGGAALAVGHLEERGHRVIGQVLGPQDVEPFRARDRGFRERAGRSRVDLRSIDDEAVSPTIEEGERLGGRLLTEHPDCTAVFAQNDLLALGVLDAIRNKGLRCPDDVAVVGYNDAFFTPHTCPPLTTVRIPTYEVGRLAGSLAISCIQRPDEPPSPVAVSPQLVVRESTATSRAAG